MWCVGVRSGVRSLGTGCVVQVGFWAWRNASCICGLQKNGQKLGLLAYQSQHEDALAEGHAGCRGWSGGVSRSAVGRCGPEPSITAAHHLQKCQGRENVGGGGGPKDIVDGCKECG